MLINSRVLSVAVLVGFFCAEIVLAAKPVGKAVSVSGRVLIRNETGSGVSKIRALKTGGGIFEGDIVNTGSIAKVKLLFNDRSVVDLGESTLFKVDEFRKNRVSRQVDLSLEYGKIRVSVNKKLKRKGRFRVKTKSATMGVRGTEFMLVSDIGNVKVGQELNRAAQGASQTQGPPTSGKTDVVVFKGEVEVEAKVPTPARQSGAKPQVKLQKFKVSGGTKFSMKTEFKGGDISVPGSQGAVASVNFAPKLEKVSAKDIGEFKKDVTVQDVTFEHAIDMSHSGDGQSVGGQHTMNEFHEEFGGEFPGFGPGEGHGIFENFGENPFHEPHHGPHNIFGQPVNVDVNFVF